VKLHAGGKIWFSKNLDIRIFIFPRYNSVFVHINHTSNMAAFYDDDVTDVTAQYVFSGLQS